jgi:nucleotide-binding universal stress UspA family protein
MYKKILIPVDLAQESSWRTALPSAINQARTEGARLHVVTVVPEDVLPVVAAHLPKNFGHRLVEEGEKHLAEFVKEHVTDEVPVQCHVGQGTIYGEILRIAKDEDVDLIVMMSHRPGMKDYLIGANAARVVRHANCSVLVVRDK